MGEISKGIHKTICRLLDEMDREGVSTPLERKSRNLLDMIYNEWEYITLNQ